MTSNRTRSRIASPAIVLTLALAVTAGCGKPPAPEQSPKAAAPAGEPVGNAPVEVNTTQAEQREVPTVIRATGTFIADEVSDVTPPVPGTITDTPVKVGDFVKAGQVVLKLDDRDARIRLKQVEAALLQAEAEALRAKTEMQRNADLARSGDISRSAYDRLTAQVAIADAGVAQSRAMLSAAEKAVDDTVVRAPFSGHVSSRPVAVGEYVTTSVKAVTLVRIQPITLNLQVPESDAARLKNGMVVQADVPAFAGVPFIGRVTALNVALDPNSRAMTVEAAFPNEGSKLSPGMFGSAQIRLPATEKAVFVTKNAIIAIANGESSAVYEVVDGKARVHVVQVGEEQNGAIRVVSGLEPGVTVATTNLERLFDGAAVRAGTSAATR